MQENQTEPILRNPSGQTWQSLTLTTPTSSETWTWTAMLTWILTLQTLNATWNDKKAFLPAWQKSSTFKNR